MVALKKTIFFSNVTAIFSMFLIDTTSDGAAIMSSMLESQGANAKVCFQIVRSHHKILTSFQNTMQDGIQLLFVLHPSGFADHAATE